MSDEPINPPQLPAASAHQERLPEELRKQLHEAHAPFVAWLNMPETRAILTLASRKVREAEQRASQLNASADDRLVAAANANTWGHIENGTLFTELWGHVKTELIAEFKAKHNVRRVQDLMTAGPSREERLDKRRCPQCMNVTPKEVRAVDGVLTCPACGLARPVTE